MSKETPGFWLPPQGKPEADVYLEGLSSLERIKNATSAEGVQLAARKAQAVGSEFGTSGVFGDMGYNPNGGSPPQGGVNPQQGQAPSNANFDAIRDDYNYRIASALYHSGSPDDVVEWSDGSVSEMYSRDMAILHISAGRQMEHVDIEVFDSIRDLDSRWDALSDGVQY